MIIQCPDCRLKLMPKPPVGTKEGTKVVVKCRCGTRLRFTMPGKPKPDLSSLFKTVDDPFPGTSFDDLFKHKGSPFNG